MRRRQTWGVDPQGEMGAIKNSLSRGESDRGFGRGLSPRLLGALALLALLVAALFFVSTLVPTLARASQPVPQPMAAARPISSGAKAGTQGSSAAPPHYRLALLTSTAKLEGNYLTVEGTVQNLDDSPIPGLLAMVTLYDRDRTARASMDALIDKSTLQPGEISTFHVALQQPPDAPFFGVQFREWHVGDVPTRDDRKG